MKTDTPIPLAVVDQLVRQQERIVELERELAEKDRQLTVALKGKRPWSSDYATKVIDGQKKRIEELESKLNGWFSERDELREQRDREALERTDASTIAATFSAK